MKPGIRIIVVILIAAMALAVANAQAGSLTLPERETVQDISWSIEILAFLAALVIAWFVWRLGKRDIKNRKNRNENRQDITRD